MAKRNITYIKPQDPKFLQQLKQEIGYKEGPSVETKKRRLEDLASDSDSEERPEREDEKPQIVVLNSGDLTEEEVAAEQKRLAQEAAEAPADLNKPIVFRKRHKPARDLVLNTVLSTTNDTKLKKNNKNNSCKLSKKPASTNTVKLSFNPDEDEEEEDQ